MRKHWITRKNCERIARLKESHDSVYDEADVQATLMGWDSGKCSLKEIVKLFGGVY